MWNHDCQYPWKKHRKQHNSWLVRLYPSNNQHFSHVQYWLSNMSYSNGHPNAAVFGGKYLALIISVNHLSVLVSVHLYIRTQLQPKNRRRSWGLKFHFEAQLPTLLFCFQDLVPWCMEWSPWLLHDWQQGSVILSYCLHDGQVIQDSTDLTDSAHKQVGKSCRIRCWCFFRGAGMHQNTWRLAGVKGARKPLQSHGWYRYCIMSWQIIFCSINSYHYADLGSSR